MTLTLAVGALTVLGTPPANAAVPTLNVTTTADIAANAGACGTTSTTVPSPLSLREATCIANNLGGTVTINIPAGTYTVASGELQPGKPSGSKISLVGAGAGTTIIDAGGHSRVLDLDANLVGGVTTSISGVTITGGADTDFGGAGIIAGSNNNNTADSLTLTNVVITGNHANTTALTATNRPGGGVQFLGGSLTISNSTISNNTSASSSGSGVEYGANGAVSPEKLSIDNTTFSGNSTANTHADPGTVVGGALAVFGVPAAQLTVTNSRFVNNSSTSGTGAGPAVGAAIYQNSGTLSVSESTFTGNTVSGGSAGDYGGAMETTTGTTSLHYNRFTGNVAPTGSAVTNINATVDATENWWGCNGGPGASGCDSVSGPVTTTPRLTLSAKATPATVTGPNATSTVTAALTTDSAGNAVAGSNLDAFDGLPVSFADPAGDATVTTSVGAHTAAFGTSTGTASIDYHSNTTTGSDPVAVTFDNATVTAALTVNQAAAITSVNAAQFTLGASSSFTVTTTGYPTPTVTESGALPSGVTFTDNGNGTATLAGTPTAGGSFPITITAANGVSPNATQPFTLTVGQAPAFTSANTATFSTGTAGSFAVTTSGTPTVTTIGRSGTLPSGLGLTDNGNGTATLSGTPAAGTGGTYPISLSATNGVPPTANQTLIVQVNQAPAVTTNPSDQTVQPGTSVTFTAAAAGVPTPTVQWQRSTNGGASFATIAGATSPSYTFTTAAGDNGNRYRAVFTNIVGAATTTAALLRVGADPAFTSANTATFAVGLAGSASVTTSGVPAAAISSSTLPAWLTLNDNHDGTATLTGTPPVGAGGSYPVTLHASNGFGVDATQGFTLLVDESPTITSTDHATFVVGSTGTFGITTTAGYPSATSLTETGTLPGGVTFVDNHDGTATLAGTPAAGTAGAYPLTLKAAATGGITAPASQSFTLTVNGPPTITSLDHATFTVGSLSSAAITTSAGYPTATTITETGTLPSGVSFVDNGAGSATLSGTPAANTNGSYPITIRASNGIAPDATQSFTLTVTQGPGITSIDHATFVVDTASTFTVTTKPGTPETTTITESGTLPAGVTFTDNGDGSATIAGTPTQSGSFPITITAGNGVLPDATQSFTLTVNGPPTITSLDHATFTVGSLSSAAITTTAGYPTATFITESGTLPGGVTLVDNGNGSATLSGTPATGTNGSYPLTITASNGIAPDSTQSFTLTVTQGPGITSPDHATFLLHQTSTFTVTTKPGTPAATTITESGTLPAGLTFIDNHDGTATIGGSPSQSGSFPVTITAGNGVLPDATQSFLLTVNAPVTITSADHANFDVGTAGTFTITTAAGYPTATTITQTGALPNGVTFADKGNGTAVLSGTPTTGAGGSYPVTVTASNGVDPDAVQSLTVTVTEKPAITSADHTTFSVGQAGSFGVTTTAGYPTATTLTESGALPTGVSFTDTGNGTATLAGTPADGTKGSYPLTITATNAVGHTDQAFTLTVGLQTQTITVTSIPPTSAPVGGSYVLAATADSTLTVAYSIDPTTTNAACSLSGATVSLDHAGQCVIDFDQAGNGTFAPAARVQQQIAVTTVVTDVGITLSAAPSVYGQPITATAVVSAGGASPAGTVQFSLDGVSFGSPVTLAGGRATSPALVDAMGNPLAPGSHPVLAAFTPADTTVYAASSNTVDQVVDHAASATALTVGATSLSAAVSPVAPSDGEPTGSVTFSVGGTPVGTVPLSGGTATLTYTVPPGMTRSVAAAYSGDTDYTASSASTSRNDPTIVATLTSAHARTRYGWYNSAVTVTFRCTTHGAPLTAPCPAALVLPHNGAGQSVSRTIAATDGGMATVVVRSINIDGVRPTVAISGVRNGALYSGAAPTPRCVAKDALSGVASCVLARSVSGTRTTITATATDRAGNRASTRVSYTTLAFYLAGAPYSGGAFTVRLGHTYTFVVVGTGTRPVYYDAAVVPRIPTKRDNAFHYAGSGRWTLGITMTTSLHTHTYWNIGAKIGNTMHVIKIRVTR